jgi:hypothetical protein
MTYHVHPFGDILGLEDKIEEYDDHLADLNNPHQVAHDQLLDVFPNQHHDQVHLLYGPDQSDVDISGPADETQGLFKQGLKFFPQYRNRYIDNYTIGPTYYPQQWVSNADYISVANTVTVDPAFPQEVGASFPIYQGASPTAGFLAKQIMFGNRYSNPLVQYRINSYRVYTIAGNEYTVYVVLDPTGTPIFEEIQSFEADLTGWVTISITPIIIDIGTAFDLVALVLEPAAIPVVFQGNWVYSTPQNALVPLTGEAIQANTSPSLLSISYIDDDGGDRTAELQSLELGDTVSTNNVKWAIQTTTDQGTYIDFTVAPALQAPPDGVSEFTFTTKAPAVITVVEDPVYWPASVFAGNVFGLFGIDVPYQDATINDSAYGTDINVTEMSFSSDWDLIAVGKGGSSSGGNFNPTTFQGAGTTGYVPDPIVENGLILSDSGAWVVAADGDKNVDGGVASSVYTAPQFIDGGTASG